MCGPGPAIRYSSASCMSLLMTPAAGWAPAIAGAAIASRLTRPGNDEASCRATAGPNERPTIRAAWGDTGAALGEPRERVVAAERPGPAMTGQVDADMPEPGQQIPQRRPQRAVHRVAVYPQHGRPASGRFDVNVHDFL